MFGKLKFGSKNRKLFEIISLNTFTDIDALYWNNKKYREVFLKEEVGYLYFDLALHNYMYRIADTEIHLKAICIEETDNNNLICTIEKDFVMGQDVSVFNIREGWGTEKLGGFWEHGKYIWQIEVNGVLLGSCSFWVDEEHFPSNHKNPYFELIEHKLFESPIHGEELSERVYANTFKAGKLRYLNQELKIYNYLDRNWPLELQVNIVNEFGEHKAFISVFKKIKANQTIVHLDLGYGAEGGDYWMSGKYKLYTSFMGKLLCQDEFEVE
jgi:hypothetical protein